MKETEQFHCNRHHSKSTSSFKRSDLGENEMRSFYLKVGRVVLHTVDTIIYII